MSRRMRIAVLTFEALASAAPVRRFVAACPERIALVALSDPMQAAPLAELRRTARLLHHSGPRILPYLAANFVLPRLAGLLREQAPSTPPARTKLAQICARLGVPVCAMPDADAPEFRARLAASGAELLVTFHCDQILTRATLAAVPRGGINVHAGPLPAQRGPVPTIHALLATPPHFGVTIHRLTPRIDAGAILAQRLCALPSGVSALTAARLLHDAARPALSRVLDAIAAGTAAERPVTPLPYCGFPPAAVLRQLARSGRYAADWRDMRRALLTPM